MKKYLLLGCCVSLISLNGWAQSAILNEEKNVEEPNWEQLGDRNSEDPVIKIDPSTSKWPTADELDENDMPSATTKVPLPASSSNVEDDNLDPIVISNPQNRIKNGQTVITQQEQNGVIKEIQVETPRTRYVLRPPTNLDDKTLQPAMWEIVRFNESDRSNTKPIAPPPSINRATAIGQ